MRRSKPIEIVYVAGPLGAPTEEQRAENIRVAEEIGAEIFAHGIYAIVPHSLARVCWGKVPEDVALEADLLAVENVHGVVLCPGWQRSRGTVGEILHAAWSGIPVWQPGTFLTGPLERVHERANNARDLLPLAEVEPHPVALGGGTEREYGVLEIARSIPAVRRALA